MRQRFSLLPSFSSAQVHVLDVPRKKKISRLVEVLGGELEKIGEFVRM